jgi:hypothetical protein
MGNRMMAAAGAGLLVVGMNQGLRLVRVSLIVLASLGAASCGGGGGGGGAASPSGPSFDLAAGIASLSASTVNATMSVSGTYLSFNATGSAQLTQSVATAAMFGGGSALMQTTTVSGMVNGFPVLYSFVQYDSSAYATLGLDINISSVLQYAVADSPIEFPSSVRAGDTAVLGTMTGYVDAAMTMAESTIQVSYVVIADPENTDSVIVEVIDKCSGFQGGGCTGQVFQFDYSLTATGSMSLQSVSILYPTTANIPADMLLFTVQ